MLFTDEQESFTFQLLKKGSNEHPVLSPTVSSFGGCLTPRSLSLRFSCFLSNSSANRLHLKIQRSAQQWLSATSPSFSFKCPYLTCAIRNGVPVFLSQFILYSVARFIFQKMESWSSLSKLLALLNQVCTSQPSIQILAAIYVCGLITMFANYTILGFCQIRLLSSSSLSWTFYIGSCHSYHKECLPLPSSCHCSRPFCISAFNHVSKATQMSSPAPPTQMGKKQKAINPPKFNNSFY